MKERTTTVNRPRTMGTIESCQYIGIGKNSLYRYFRPAMMKIGSRTLWDRVIIDQIIDAKRRKGETE